MQNNYYTATIEFCDKIEQPKLTKSFLSTRHKHLTLKLRDLDNGIQVSINQGQTPLGEKILFRASKTITKEAKRHLSKKDKMLAGIEFPKDCNRFSEWMIENKICF